MLCFVFALLVFFFVLFFSLIAIFLCVLVLESLDNGKPIRETRDADVNVVARWFYHYAGWAQVNRCDIPLFRMYKEYRLDLNDIK